MLRRALLTACIASATLSQPTQCDNDSAASPDISHRSGQDIIAVLGLVPSAEGGYYFETFRDDALMPSSNRSVSTAIYYLLEGPNVPSAWHSVDAAEVWHWYAGAPLTLEVSQDDGSPTTIHYLGPELFNDQRPQAVVPAHNWQRALSWGDWTLVGTTVAPAFVPEGYAQAPPGWKPRGA